MMKVKKIPMRSCVVTHEKYAKNELIRVVRTPEGKILIDDEAGKSNGRGAYLKKDLDVIKKAQANKILDRVLEIEIPNEIYEELKTKIK